MSFLLFNKKEEEVSLLIDIGNGTITVATAVFSGKVPEFIHCIKSPFPINDKLDGLKLISSMGNLLDNMLSTTIKYGLKDAQGKVRASKITRAVVSFTSPWHTFKSKEVKIQNEIPFLVTPKLLEEILDKEAQIFKKELSVNDDESKHSWSVIEKSIIHTKINGYILNDSLGRKTKSLELFIYLSAIGSNIEHKILSKISKHTHLPMEKILVHTFPLATFVTIRDTLKENESFLLLDVTGEGTDISVVQGDFISNNAVLPLGRNFIIRQIAKHFKTPIDFAESTLSLFLLKKVNEGIAVEIQKILLDVEKEWFIYFQDIIHSFFPNGVLPSKVYITVDDDVAPIFVEYLKSFKIEIVLLNEETLKGLYSVNSKVSPDQFIVILSDFYNNLKKNQ